MPTFNYTYTVSGSHKLSNDEMDIYHDLLEDHPSLTLLDFAKQCISEKECFHDEENAVITSWIR